MSGNVPSQTDLRRRVWRSAFLDMTNPDTFMNYAGAARFAGYAESSASQSGRRNFRYFEKDIRRFMDRHGMSDLALDAKTLELQNARKVHFHCVTKTDPEGNTVTTYERHFEPNHTIQLKALEMANKVYGRFAPERHVVMGGTNSGGTQRVTPEMRSKLTEIYGDAGREEEEDPLAL